MSVEDKSLTDYAAESKKRADAERTRKEFYQPPADGREAHIRILPWPGHKPCWVEFYVHYLDTPEGKRMLACGEEQCYTCQKLADLTHSQDKDDLNFVRQSARKLKVYMYVLDWDNISAGPQLWEPKNTQNCGTWPTIINLIHNPEYGERLFSFREGLLLNLTLHKETRKLRSGNVEMYIQKSCFPGRDPKSIEHAKDVHGVSWIRVQLPSGNKAVFKLPDLGDMIIGYDEEYHIKCWGDEEEVEQSVFESAPEDSSPDSSFSGGSGGGPGFEQTPESGEVTFDDGESGSLFSNQKGESESPVEADVSSLFTSREAREGKQQPPQGKPKSQSPKTATRTAPRRPTANKKSPTRPKRPR